MGAAASLFSRGDELFLTGGDLNCDCADSPECCESAPDRREPDRESLLDRPSDPLARPQLTSDLSFKSIMPKIDPLPQLHW